MKMTSVFKIDLAGLKEKVPARIRGLDLEGPERDRLEAMGLCVGRAVEVVQAGDPMIVRVLGTRIGLAATLARVVRVETQA
jgi:Fe2+ transport system protein FeoA